MADKSATDKSATDKSAADKSGDGAARAGGVERCELAPGLSIARVLTGLWQVADMERDGRAFDVEAAARAMESYLDAGLSTFDMADHYGSAELVAGRLRARRGAGEAQMLTKWVPPPGPVTREDARAAVLRALERLRSERLELLQFHAWTFADPHWLDALFYLQELKEEGLIGHLGVTNFDAAHLQVALASGVELVSNQVCFSLLDRRPQGALGELCRERGVKLLAYGTVAGGFLTERWLDAPEPKELMTWSQMKYKRFIDAAGGWEAYQSLLRALSEVAGRQGASLANVASRYVLDDDAVAGVIIGARLGQSEHIKDTLRLFSLRLSDEDRAAIAEALEVLRPLPGDSGDEYRKPPFLTASGDLSHHLEALPPPLPVEARADGRRVALSGTPWEAMAGYCRAVRVDDRILVSGTTATHRGRLVGGADAAAQFHAAVDKIEGALISLGGRLEDTVRTRVYVARLDDWEGVARAHGARFGDILPVNTLVQAALVGPEYLVEVEAEAVVGAVVGGDR